MNYLAHAYLSFNDPGILTGNMISDYVKGKQKFDFPERIQQGMNLHRLIDEYTDHHDVTRELQKIFKSHYGLYSGPIIDVILDYFIATDNAIFNKNALMNFSLGVYESLAPFSTIFPEKFARMFPYMKSQNWLYHYQFHEGIKNSLGGLARRAKYLDETETAFQLFIIHLHELQQGYDAFFPDLKKIATEAFKSMDPV